MTQIIPETWFHNSVQVKYEDNAVIPLRFSDRQLAVYSQQENWRQRSLSPAGIAIKVKTDASEVKINYEIKNLIRSQPQFDIYLDDTFSQSISAITEIGRAVVSIPIPASTQMQELTIYLPHCAEFVIYEINFSAGATVKPVAQRKHNLLCLGDSITQGMDALYPSLTYPVQVAQFLKMNLLNQGVGGYIFDHSSLDSKLDYKPDLITVAYGTNDWGVAANKKEFETMCHNYLDTLSRIYQTTPIYVITPLWRKDHQERRPCGSFGELQQSITDIANNFSNIEVVDGLKLIPHQEQFFSDRSLHPSDTGFLYLSLALLSLIKL